MSASEIPSQVPSTAEADAHLIGLARLEGAERLFSDAALSQAVGRPVTATHLRLKPGQSVTVAWQSTGAGPAEHGWAQVTADSDKIRKTLSRAEKAHCPDQVTVHELPGSVLLIGSVWTDPKLAVELHRAHRRQAQARGSDEPWQVLRFNPGRRLVARAGQDVLRVHTSPLDGPTGMVQTVRRWRSWDLPVLPLRSLGGHGTAASSPFWGAGDALALPHPDTARAAGELIGRLHSRRAARSPLPAVPLRVRSSAESVAESAPWLAEAARALAARLEPLLLRDLSDSPAVELHGDLSPDQLLVATPGSTEVRLIDVDRAGAGPAARDLGSWLAACRRQGTPEIGEAFLNGYAAHAPLPEDRTIAAWESSAHLLAALDPLRHRAPDWPQRVTERLQGALDALPRPTASAGGPSSSPTRAQPATADPDAPAALPDVVVTAEGTAWRVERVWPGKTDEPDAPLSVEVRADGALRAGLWTPRGLELFPAGRDRRLPALEPLVQQGAEVVSHRPRRRAVVRHQVSLGAVRYTKIVRAGRAEAILDGISRAAAFERGFRTPAVLGSTEATVTFAELDGRSLHRPDLFSGADWERAWSEVMDALEAARLPVSGCGSGIPEHGPAEEAGVLRDWTDRAAPWVRDLAAFREAMEQTYAGLEDVGQGDSNALVPTHRDLHDKQLVWSAEHSPGPGLLDVDTACLGHPALDLGNLRAHAQWRRRQGVWSAERAETVIRAVDGLAARTGVEEAVLGLFERAALLRIRCVYAFRPVYAGAAEELQRQLPA
ncbi:phosphotransferase [Micrococcus terreus]|uniref:Phosphotransferase enzyme family protein n=1 Tax=Micrococcus terreus TaxID=574650 RepID=A0A1I7MDZ6_9MICC|nr:phosphotransferase [Micrococcus terreus]SFV20159.1 Phosphotransferase enzyme family protein [Micrococcus terreus]